ncbi:sulfotransferase [Komagataeibacter nataicola]|uniref:sulfotransferase family protein n=1 Tax=Komagataeibacter nataicola TaxID=265960 RepID=UPI0023DD126D|nr:sulfotransferase [Komagataeibacter nataicola]WEQ54971.1 sulfotransferase [Komagataeibacter nataicola]
MSGLPRSGSTLLSALLMQHPEVAHAGYSGPVASMMIKLTSVMVEGEYQSEFDHDTKGRILRGVLYNYYDSDGTSGKIIDNNRMWCTRLVLINELFPAARVICCVRDPVWIIDSFERIMQKDPFLGSKIVPIHLRGNLYDRVDHLLSKDGPFGYCWRALNEAYFHDLAHKLIVVDYDKLTTDPVDTMRRITKALGLPEFLYDFKNINAADAFEFDSNLSTPGLHDVRSTVSPNRRRPIITSDITARLAGGAFWKDPNKNPGGATIIT